MNNAAVVTGSYLEVCDFKHNDFFLSTSKQRLVSSATDGLKARCCRFWLIPHFPGILALLRAMASSTAFSCFSSSSRRERVLLGLPEPGPVAGALDLPADAVRPFPEDLGGGDCGRFLDEQRQPSHEETKLVI